MPFSPPSPAKHIKALLLRRHGSVKPNVAAIPEGEETKGANLDKRFGFSKQFASKYEIGEEMGRGHFGYTCSAIVKIGELKGQKVVVKKELITLGLLEWNKSRVTAEIPKYGKKVPKNTISAVAGFTAVYWKHLWRIQGLIWHSTSAMTRNSNIPSKDWMDLARYSKPYIDGVKSFLDFAYSYGDPQGEEIQCPCAKCCNIHWTRRNAEGVYDGPNEDAKKYYNLVEEASQELYPGCTGFSKLSFTLRLYLLKCLHGWSNESFTSLLELLKEAMPDLNIPPSYNKTKSMVKNLGLDYEKIDACPNDCLGMIIRMMNFVILAELHDILKILKLITVDSLRWHDEERSKDGKLRHPADGQAWKDFDRRARNNDECDPSDVETVSLFPKKGCPLGAKKTNPFILDNKTVSQAYAYLLGNCDEIQEYIREHEHEVNNHSRRSKWSKAKDHCQNFSQWFETRALQEDVPDLIKQLSRGPNFVAKRYSGYLINGYRFHIRQRDVRRKTQNCGVTLVASTTSFASSKDKNPIAAVLTYYGRIVDIVELDHYSHFKEEPFVLASQLHQCFYVQDPYDQDTHYVMKPVSRDLFNLTDEFEYDLPQIYQNELSEHLMGSFIPEDDGEVPLFEDKSEEELEDEFEKEFEDGSENEYEDDSEDESENESKDEFEDNTP
ncbi:hypothetical protein KY289_029229 [Solanum tuberosum]|nr:hypothetical protein KY289_029229 [Solanum tuberosum]